MKILIATKNEGKIAELRSLLSDERHEFIGLDALSDIPDVEETGNTFAENAKLKAAAYSTHFGLHTLADDSGLEVQALNGRPGVFSARYGGVKKNYDAKIRLLLEQLDEAENKDRRARFVSHIAFASPNGDVLFEAEGVCEGSIAFKPKGTNGFGYDPVFIPAGFDQTFGELSDQVKQKTSHRARAIAKIMRYLRDFA
ncbi:MAG: non-canonical purine NTP pyrophosphatase, RdgB/HAM1 family [Acidobacteria bacterium]|nr:MAG: non-canonical purine NTP pyrophosphatase, RdgB/HAM1 family [Acidobacteriota bacterium]